MNNSANTLVEGLERLGLIASRIRKNEGDISQIEIDIILQELRSLYLVALQHEIHHPEKSVSDTLELDLTAAAQKAAAEKAAEEKRMAEEAAAKKAAEEKRMAEEAAAKKAAEEKRMAEEAAAKKAAEEKRMAEEAAAKKAAEEKRMAEEAAAKKAAEEKRMAEEAAAKKAAELAAAAKATEEFKPIFAPDEPHKKEEPIMDPMMEKLAGNPNDELFDEEPQRPASIKKEKPHETSLFDFINANEAQPKRTLADTLGQRAANVEQRLEHRVNAKKVDDLRTIIGIYDKFSFMSELFHNNMKAYNDFILHLNATPTREEALEYVAQIAKEFNWKEGSSAVVGFWKIFDRKF